MGSQRALFTMAPTRVPLLPAAFLLLCFVATTARAQPRQARQDGESKEETTTSSQVSTTTKETMVDAEDANEVIDPMEQCSKCRKAAYTYKKKFFCQKCVKEGHIKEADTVVNCDKCRKPRYRARNGDFCGGRDPRAGRAWTHFQVPGSNEHLGRGARLHSCCSKSCCCQCWRI